MIPDIYQTDPLEISHFEEVHSLFVLPFEASRTRPELWNSLTKLIEYLKNYKYLHCVDIMYVDGDFISQASNPEHVNILLVFDFNLISSEKGIENFLIWKEDFAQICNTLFKGVKIATSLSNINQSNPQHQTLNQYFTQLIQRNLNFFSKVPNRNNQSKLYLILNDIKNY